MDLFTRHGVLFVDHGSEIDHSQQMDAALAIYLSDMSETDKLAAIRLEFTPLAVMLDAITGSTLIRSWENDEIALEATFVALGWI